MRRRPYHLKTIKRSHRPEKKFDAIFVTPDGKTRTTSFGAAGMSDFTKNKNTTRKQRYLKRHGRMGENWNDPISAGALSRWILWNKKTLKASIADYKAKFNL